MLIVQVVIKTSWDLICFIQQRNYEGVGLRSIGKDWDTY